MLAASNFAFTCFCLGAPQAGSKAQRAAITTRNGPTKNSHQKLTTKKHMSQDVNISFGHLESILNFECFDELFELAQKTLETKTTAQRGRAMQKGSGHHGGTPGHSWPGLALVTGLQMGDARGRCFFFPHFKHQNGEFFGSNKPNKMTTCSIFFGAL